jgi:hypothetical protein
MRQKLARHPKILLKLESPSVSKYFGVGTEGPYGIMVSRLVSILTFLAYF